jgi:type I restriction enzyme S subunit
MAFNQVRIGDYFKFEKGLGYKGEFLAEESDVALIGMDSHEEGGGYKEGSEKPYSGPFKEVNEAKPGDVIFAATDLTQDGHVLGSPLLVPESEEFQTFIYSHHLLKAFQKKEGFLPEYLYNLYRVEKFRKKAAYADSGTTVRALPAEVLEEQVVPLPNLPTQLAINEIISLIDQQIANNKALSRNLEALAQSIFKSWFIDFDPVHAKKKGENPFGMDAETANLFPDSFEKSEIGDIPKDWEVLPLDQMCEFLNGLALQKYPPKSKEDQIPVIKIAQLRSGNTSKADQASAGIQAKYIIANGDILFSWSASLLVEHWVSGVGALNQHLFKVTGKQVSNLLSYFYTKASLPTFQAIASEKATSMGHIQRSHLSDEKYAIPSKDCIEKLSLFIKTLVDQKIQALESNNELRTLLERLMSGLILDEISVPSELIPS